MSRLMDCTVLLMNLPPVQLEGRKGTHLLFLLQQVELADAPLAPPAVHDQGADEPTSAAPRPRLSRPAVRRLSARGNAGPPFPCRTVRPGTPRAAPARSPSGPGWWRPRN